MADTDKGLFGNLFGGLFDGVSAKLGNVSWASGASVAIGGLTGLMNWYAQNQAAKLPEELRRARNKVAASQNSLAATVRSINNDRLLEVAGKQFNALGSTLSRQRDAAAGNRFEQSIRFAETEGAMAAQRAASGVGGTAVEASGLAMAFQQARLTLNAERTENYVTYNTMAQMAGIVPAALGSRDQSPMGGNIDYVRRGNQGPGLFGLLTSVGVGMFGKNKELQTFLDSLTGQDSTGMGGGNAVVTSSVYRGNVQGAQLPAYGPVTIAGLGEGATSSPVLQSRPVGTDLPRMAPIQRANPISSTLGGI